MRTDFRPGESPQPSAPVAQWLETREIHAEDGVVLIADREVLLTSMYARSGVDLVIQSPGGIKYIVKGFFLNDNLPTLSDGATTHIPGELAQQFAGSIAPEQYAAAAGGAAAPVAGVVRSLSGEVRVVRASDGSEVVLKIGDPLYQGDIVETSAGGAVGLVFVDGTTLALGENGELVLDELVYDPSKAVGKGVLTLVSGAAEFVSGGIAKSGADNMTFKTPVATIGIRGTRVLASWDPVTGNVTILNRPTGTDAAGNETAGVISLTLPDGTQIGNMTAGNGGWQWNADPATGAALTQPAVVAFTPQQVQALAGAILDSVNSLQTQIQQQPNLIPTPQGAGTNAPTGGAAAPADGTTAPAGPGAPGAAPAADGTTPAADGTAPAPTPTGAAPAGGAPAGDGAAPGAAPPTTPPPQVTQTPVINTGNVAASLATTGNPQSAANTGSPTVTGTTGTTSSAGASGTSGTTGTGGTTAGTGTTPGAGTTTPGVTTPTTPTVTPPTVTPPTPLPQPVVFSISGGEASDATESTITFTVTRSGNTSVAASVSYATSSGSAGAGSDFIANFNTVNFAVGETEKTIVITVLPNPGIIEAAETFSVTLSGASATGGAAANISVAQATGTIAADILPTLAIGDTAVTDLVNGSAVLTVTRSGNLDVSSTVSYRFIAGTAAAGADFTDAPGTLTFAVGQATAQITIPIIGDTAAAAIEPDETFQVELFSPVGAVLAAGDASGTVTIAANALPAITLGSGPTVTDLVSGSAVVTLTRTGNLDLPATVSYRLIAGTATAGSDFGAAPGSVTFAAGQATAQITVPIVGDTAATAVEPTETFQIELFDPVGARIAGEASAIVTITGNAFPTLSIGNATVTDVAGVNAVLTVTRAGNLDVPSTVSYRLIAGTASAGSDFGAAPGTVTFAAGQATAQITVPIVGDTPTSGSEPVETFQVELFDPVGARLSPGEATGTVTITADPLATFSINSVGNILEGGTAVLTVTRGGDLSRSVSVSYEAQSGTATVGADFAVTSGVLTFAPNQTTQTISVSTVLNNVVEPAESFSVVLSNPIGGTIAAGTGQVSMLADPPLPSMSITGGSISDVVAGTLVFTVSLSGPPGPAGVTVMYVAESSSAVVGSDFEPTFGLLTFFGTQTTRTISVPILANATNELTEGFTVRIYDAVGAIISVATAAGTILADPLIPQISVFGGGSVGDGGEGSTSFTVSLSAATTVPVTVAYTTVAGSADASDFTPTSGTLTFAPGQTSLTVTVPIHANATGEPDEDFSFVISGPTNGTIGIGSASVVITADPTLLSGPILTLLADLPALANRDVVITDAATIAQIKTIDTANGSGTLTLTAISDTAAGLIAGVHYITDAVTVTINGPVSLETLKYIDAHTTGTVTYSQVGAPASLLLANMGYISATTAVNVFVSGFGVSPSQLTALDAAGGTVTVFDTTVGLLTGGYLTSSYGAQIINPTTVADLEAIKALASPGLVSYGVLADTADAIVTYIGSASITGHQVTVLVPDSTAASNTTPANLDAIEAASGLPVVVRGPASGLSFVSDFDGRVVVVAGTSGFSNAVVNNYIGANASAVVVEDSAANILSANVTGGAYNVNIIGDVSLANLAAVDALTTGTLKYGSVTGTATALAANTTYVTGQIRVVVSGSATAGEVATIASRVSGSIYLQATAATLLANVPIVTAAPNVVLDVSQAAASIAQLTALDALTPLNVVYGTVADTMTNLTANAGGYVFGTHNVTILGVATIAQINAIDAMTTPAVVYTAIEDTSSNIAANVGGRVGSASTISVMDTVSVATLKILDGIPGSAVITALSVSDTVQNIARGVDYITASTNITFTDPVSVEVITKTLSFVTSGTLTFGTVIGTPAVLLGSGLPYISNKNVEVNAGLGTVTSGNLASIDAANGTGTVTVVGSASAIHALVTSSVITSSYGVKVNEPISIAQLSAIRAVVPGMQFNSVWDTAANILAYTGGGGSINGHVVSILVPDSTAASNTTNANIASIDSANGAGQVLIRGELSRLLLVTNFASKPVIITDGIAASGYTNANGTSLISAGAASVIIEDTFVNFISAGISGSYNATITGPAPSVAEVIAVTALTSGTVSYGQIADTVVNLTGNAGLFSFGAIPVIIGAVPTVAAVESVMALTTGAVGLRLTAAQLVSAAPTFAAEFLPIIAMVTDTANLNQLQIIEGLSPLGISYFGIADTISNLLTNAGGFVNGDHPISVTNTATATQLDTLDGMSNGVITPVHITGTYAQVFAFTTDPDFNVSTATFTVSDPISTGQYNALDAATTGTINYTPIGGNQPPVVQGVALGVPYLQMDGTDDRIVTGSISLGSHSMEMWVRTTVDGSAQNLVSAGSMPYLVWTMTNGKIQLELSDGTNTKVVETVNDSFADGAWHHLAYTFNATNGQVLIYVDGLAETVVQQGGNLALGANFSSPFSLTAAATIAGTGFTGDIGDVRIWNGVRTAPQILEHHNVALNPSDANLRVYYTFDGFDFSDSPTVDNRSTVGGAALDGTASGPTGAQQGPRTIEPGIGKALHFDGTNDYVDTNVINMARSFTLQASIRLDDGPGVAAYERTIFGKPIISGTGPYGDWEFHVYIDTTNHVVFQVSDGTSNYGEIISVGVIPKDAWHTVTVTYDDQSGQMQLYIDGSAKGGDTVPGPRISGHDDLRVGHLGGATGFFAGDITRVSIWEGALDGSTVNTLAVTGNPNPNTEGVLASYTFSDGHGSVLNDAGTGHIYDGVIHGATWVDHSPPIAQPVINYTVTEDSPFTFRVIATDPNGHTVTIGNTSSTNGGSVTSLGGGYVRYSPAQNFNGSDQFTLLLSDGSGGTTNQTINVTVLSVNDRPLLLTNANSDIPDVDSGDPAPAGTAFTTLFAGGNFVDPDSGANFSYVVIVENDADAGSQGTWQYSTNAGNDWFDVGAVANDLSGLVVSSTALVRFVSVDGYTGYIPPLNIRALDSVYTGDVSSEYMNSEIRVTLSTEIGSTTVLMGPLLSVSGEVLAGNAAPVLIAAVSNNFFEFDGDDFLQSTGPAQPTLTSHTLEGWVRITPGASTQMLVVAIGSSTTAARMFIDDGKVVADIVTPGGVKRYVSDDAIINNDWHHVAYSYDATTQQIKIYVDGELVTATAASNDPTSGFTVTGDIFVGGYAASDFFHGALDEVRIWNDVRTPDEIANFRALYIGGSAPGIVANYTFDDPGATVATYTDENINVASNGYDLEKSPGITTPVTGRTALHFDGINDHAVATTLKSLGGSFTIEARIRVDDTSGDRVILSKGTSAGVAGEFAVFINANNRLELHMGDGATIVEFASSSTVLAPNRWYDIAVVYDHATGINNVQLYVDGVIQTISGGVDDFDPADRQTQPGGVEIGRGTVDGLTQYFEGAIAGIQIWEVPLDGSAIADHITNHAIYAYDLYYASAPDESGIVANYLFTQGRDIVVGGNRTVFDSSGLGHNAVITGGSNTPEWILDQAPQGIANSTFYLYAFEDTPTVFHIVGYDPEGTPLTFALHNGPNNGDVIIDQQGRITYTPDANSSNSDSFTIRVTDYDGRYRDQHVSVQVTSVNDAPQLTSNNTFELDSGDTTTVGNTIATYFGGDFVDHDGSSFYGVAIVGNLATAGQGVYQFWDDYNDQWVAIPTTVDNAGQGLILSKDALIRFVPANGYDGTPGKLLVRPLDSQYQSGGSGPTTADETGTLVYVDTSRGNGRTVILGDIVLLGAVVIPLLAWDGGVSGLWTLATNWAGDVAPSSADKVVIENAIVTYAAGTATTVHALKLDDADLLITNQNGEINVNTRLLIEGDSFVQIDGAMTIGGNIENGGEIELDYAGNAATLTTGGIFFNDETITVFNDGDIYATDSIVNAGDMIFKYATSLVLGNFANQLGALLKLEATDNGDTHVTFGGYTNWENNGTVRLISTGTGNDDDVTLTFTGGESAYNRKFFYVDGGGGTRTIDYSALSFDGIVMGNPVRKAFYNESGGRIEINTNTTFIGGIFENKNGAQFDIAPSVTLTVQSGRFILADYNWGGPPQGPLGLGGSLHMKAGSTLETEDTWRVYGSGASHLTLVLGDEGSAPVTWKSWGGSGFSYTTEVTGVIDMFSASLNLTPDVGGQGDININNASATSGNDSVIFHRGLNNNGDIFINATSSASNLTIKKYIDDNSDGNNVSASVSTAYNNGVITLNPGTTGQNARLIIDGLGFTNTGDIVLEHDIGSAIVTLQNSATFLNNTNGVFLAQNENSSFTGLFKNTGTIQISDNTQNATNVLFSIAGTLQNSSTGRIELGGTASSNYGKLTVGTLTLAGGTLALTGAAFANALDSDTFSAIISYSSRNEIFWELEGFDAAWANDIAMYPVYSGGDITIQTVEADYVDTGATDSHNYSLAISGKVVLGLGGNDEFQGSAFSDLFLGGTDDDTFFVSLGNDKFIGGEGSDTVDYGDAIGAVTASLRTGVATIGAKTDTIWGIENLVGGDLTSLLIGNGLNNTLEGGALADILYGDGGNDTLIGNGGADTLNGTEGADTMTGGAGADHFEYMTYDEFKDDFNNSTIDTITDFTSGTDKFYFEQSGFGFTSPGALVDGVNFKNINGFGELTTISDYVLNKPTFFFSDDFGDNYLYFAPQGAGGDFSAFARVSGPVVASDLQIFVDV